LNETEDAIISSDKILESPNINIEVENSSVPEVQMPGPELNATVNGNAEAAASETELTEGRTKLQRHAKSLKKAISHPKTDEHQFGEEASD
jgi:hypothetical protein